jgi:hypothetical protein
VLVAQFGESANTLVRQWTGGYRYGFPSFRAAEPPVRPMHYDQSQIYSGVIGRQYKDSTNRYNYLYDPNMYLQPGFSGFGVTADGMSTQTKVMIGVGASVLVLGAVVVLARHQLNQPRMTRKFAPRWARDSGEAYRAGRRLRR